MRKILLSLTVTACAAAGAANAQQVEGTILGSGALPHPGSSSTTGDFLTQPPTQIACFISDPEVPQILADNFVVSGPIQIDELVLWGFYSTDSIPGQDSFQVRFMLDAGGLPGANAAPPEVNVPSTRFDTGVNFVFMDEYQFTLSLVSPVALDPGTYWVEIYNDLSGTPDLFCWEAGMLDPTNGIPDSARSRQVPPANWDPLRFEMSLELNGVVIPVELESFEIEK